jgi:glutathione synthase/RimK-type ligase-like ATP-grasp enzyme
MATSRIGLVTCSDLSRYFPSAEHPLITHDDLAVVRALQAVGHSVEPLVWGADPVETARDFDLLILRSTWDYMDSPSLQKAFRHWLAQLAQTPLAVENHPALMLWNLDKHYLRDLADHGLSVVPTQFIEDGESPNWDELFRDWGRLVLKPCVSAAAVDTFRFGDLAEAQRFPFATMRQGRDFMVQPFLSEVMDRGEYSLIFIEGQLTHAVLKRPQQGHWLVQDERGGSVFSQEAPAEVQTLAQQAAKALVQVAQQVTGEATGPLYARIDIIPCTSGPLLSEVELIEPELFFLERTPQGPRPCATTIEVFCRAVERRLAKGKA